MLHFLGIRIVLYRATQVVESLIMTLNISVNKHFEGRRKGQQKIDM